MTINTEWTQFIVSVLAALITLVPVVTGLAVILIKQLEKKIESRGQRTSDEVVSKIDSRASTLLAKGKEGDDSTTG